MNFKDSKRFQFRKFIKKKMLSVTKEESNKKKVESQVVQILNKTNYSLNVVNRYKENIVHVSAANNCTDILKCILQKHDKHCLERKNSFGWTPLMQAVRNENVEMVKCLLKSGAVINDFSFLGMSVISLACAISNEMFDLLNNHCPTALEYAAHDDINPLCITSLKNDKELFFKLVDLGLNIRKANALTHTMMKRSTVPEIAVLAKSHLSSEDYWSDLSEIIDLLGDEENYKTDNSEFTNFSIPTICVETVNIEKIKKVPKNKMNLCLNLQPTETKPSSKNLISPTLSYFNERQIPISPNIFVSDDNLITKFKKCNLNIEENTSKIKSNNKIQTANLTTENFSSPLVLQRCQSKRPPNLKLSNSSIDSNATLSFTPQFSPTKTPNLPCNINEDNIFNETTPTPPKYKTPPRGIVLDPNTTRLMFILQQFGLKRHIPTFLDEEVDLDLFLTLNDKDLIEIGIDKKSERLILLSVINECRGVKNVI